MPEFGTRSLNGGERVWKLAGANLVVRVGGDPIAPFLRANRGEDADIAGDHEAQRIDRVPDPADIGDDRGNRELSS